MSTIEDIGNDFVEMLKQQAEAFGVELKDNLDDVASFTAERLRHLRDTIGEPGYERAVAAERDAILLRATSDAITSADQLDQRMLAAVQGVLTFGARALDVVL